MAAAEVEVVKCECCGLTEECTLEYVARIKERYGGRWICGLCSEAVKEEVGRSAAAAVKISTEEALDRHMSFSKKFRPGAPPPPANPAEQLVVAMRQLLRRSLDSPRAARSAPGSPRVGPEQGGVGGRRRTQMARSESCFSTLAG